MQTLESVSVNLSIAQRLAGPRKLSISLVSKYKLGEDKGFGNMCQIRVLDNPMWRHCLIMSTHHFCSMELYENMG